MVEQAFAAAVRGINRIERNAALARFVREFHIPPGGLASLDASALGSFASPYGGAAEDVDTILGDLVRVEKVIIEALRDPGGVYTALTNRISEFRLGHPEIPQAGLSLVRHHVRIQNGGETHSARHSMQLAAELVAEHALPDAMAKRAFLDSVQYGYKHRPPLESRFAVPVNDEWHMSFSEWGSRQVWAYLIPNEKPEYVERWVAHHQGFLRQHVDMHFLRDELEGQTRINYTTGSKLVYGFNVEDAGGTRGIVETLYKHGWVPVSTQETDNFLRAPVEVDSISTRLVHQEAGPLDSGIRVTHKRGRFATPLDGQLEVIATEPYLALARDQFLVSFDSAVKEAFTRAMDAAAVVGRQDLRMGRIVHDILRKQAPALLYDAAYKKEERMLANRAIALLTDRCLELGGKYQPLAAKLQDVSLAGESVELEAGVFVQPNWHPEELVVSFPAL